MIPLDGLLITGSPDSQEDIIVIAPQVTFCKIRTQLLGGNGWNSPEVVRKGGMAVEGAVFAEGYIERDTPAFQKLASDFRTRFKKEPDMVATLGYDALTLLVNAVKSDRRAPDAIRDYLTGMNNFSGASGTITFAGGRVNSNAYIMKIADGRIVQVK
jgi:branched-chain amino acid transport system substrate-binding protein